MYAMLFSFTSIFTVIFTPVFFFKSLSDGIVFVNHLKNVLKFETQF